MEVKDMEHWQLQAELRRLADDLGGSKPVAAVIRLEAIVVELKSRFLPVVGDAGPTGP